MGGRRDDSAPGGRGWLIGGVVLAAGATVAVLAVDDARYLRMALLAVCWTFVVAAFLAGSRRADSVAAASREAELRAAYDLELEREVAARHAHEAQLESRLRAEAEDGIRTELSRLRAELTGLGELRDDLGRMRVELTEQLSGELLIERMVMRAQSVRGPAQLGDLPGGRVLAGEPSWEPPARAGAWEVDRWSHTQVLPAEPAPQLEPAPPEAPPTIAVAGIEADVPPVAPQPPSPMEWLVGESVLEPWVEASPPSPLEWLGDRALLEEDVRPARELPAVPAPAPPRHRRRAPEPDVEVPAPPVPVPPLPAPATAPEPPSWQAAPVAAGSPSYDSAAYDEMLFGPSVTSAEEPASSAAGERSRPGPSGHARLEQILAESGVAAPSGGRSRRRRYREDDETADDVLARVLGRL